MTSVYALAVVKICAHDGCEEPVPPASSPKRLYCSKICKMRANGRVDYVRNGETVKAKARAWNTSRRGQDLTLQRRYGITYEQREETRERQGGTCFFCSVTQLSVDHDHQTGRFRGLLCRAHNVLLGHLGDGDVERINVFLAYLGLEPTRRLK